MLKKSLWAAFALLASTGGAFAASDLAVKGEYLARAGDCVACHSVPNRAPFSGGLKMGTPLGNIYSTNITPDKETGIGSYSLSDFEKAVRRGIAKDGRHLYPAMPYPSYAKISDADIAALYAYFMEEVKPAKQENEASEIPFPWNMRWPLAIWNTLFVSDKPFTPAADQDSTWNRGAYLVQGLGHCGACHTPRGIAFQEKALDESDSNFVSGATLDGWTALSLRGDQNAGLGRWTEEDITTYLKEGRNQHASVIGSMLDAYNNSTQFLTDDDRIAIARYLKSLPAASENETVYAYDKSTAEAFARGDLKSAGASIYLAQCAGCHGRDGKAQNANVPPLAGNPGLLGNDASSIINVVLNGTGRAVSHEVPSALYMRPYRLMMNDQDIAEVVNFVRNSWGNKASSITAKEVSDLRASTNMSSDRVVILKMR